jgi:hypothetical protein
VRPRLAHGDAYCVARDRADENRVGRIGHDAVRSGDDQIVGNERGGTGYDAAAYQGDDAHVRVVALTVQDRALVTANVFARRWGATADGERGRREDVRDAARSVLA